MAGSRSEGQRRAAQESVADFIARDTRPFREWAQSMARLPARLYEHDPQLSRRFELFIRDLESSAANLDCIGTDDPTAPPIGSSADVILAYFLTGSDGATFRKLISRADQLLGRQALVDLIEPVVT